MNSVDRIKNIIKKLVEYNNKISKEQLTLEEVYIGEIVEKDGAIGCVEGKDGWYFYSFWDHTNDSFIGPFSVDGIIRVLATQLDIVNDIQFLKLTKDEEKIYFNNFISYDDFWETKKL